ncbi:MAG: hypothetical protein WC747_01315 [Candidatus Babeliales bacterium]|jgi:hypothetical protein
MNKQTSSILLLCGILATVSLQAYEGGERSGGLVKRDFSQRGSPTEKEQNTARVNREQEAARVKQEADLKQRKEEEAARQDALEKEKQLKARQALEQITDKTLFPEGHDAPVQTNEPAPTPTADQLYSTGVKAVEPVEDKVSVKSISDRLVDESNDFFKAKGDKKESFAKTLLGLPDDVNLTETQIMKSSFAKMNEFRKYEKEDLVIEQFEKRIVEARKILIDRLKSKKSYEITKDSFEVLKAKPDDVGKSGEKKGVISQFKKLINDLIDKVVSLFRKNDNQKESKKALSNVLSPVFDSSKNEAALRTKIVEEKFQVVAKSEPEIAIKIQQEVGNITDERLKKAKTPAERKNIQTVGNRLKSSLEPKKQEQDQASEPESDQYFDPSW